MTKNIEFFLKLPNLSEDLYYINEDTGFILGSRPSL